MDHSGECSICYKGREFEVCEPTSCRDRNSKRKRCDGIKIVRFKDEFNPLWYMLSDWGRSAVVISNESVVTQFPLPQVSQSILNGIPYITDPSSEVIVYSFTNENPNGPIMTEEGFQLKTYSDAINFKIEWIVEGEVDECFKIGFYTSDDFDFLATNNLYLISGDRGASLFAKPSGSFICETIMNFYVATNRNVPVKIIVTAVIPKARFYPDYITKPYTQYLFFKDECGRKYEIPVYTLTVVEDIYVSKEPTKYVMNVANIISKFLNDTSLSITLFEPPLSNNRPFVRDVIRTYKDVPTVISPYRVGGTLSLNTDNFSTRIGVWGINNRSFRLDTAPRVVFPPNIAYYHKVLLTIKTAGDEFNPVIKPVYDTYLTNWPFHNLYDPSTGKVKAPPVSYLITSDPITYEFILNPNSKNFGFEMYQFGPSGDFNKVSIPQITVEFVKGVTPKG